MQLNSCSLCGLQYQPHLTILFDVPVYHPASDSVKIANRRTCKQCCMIITNIQSFIEQNQTRFCNHNFKSHVFDYYTVERAPQPKKSIQLLYATACQTLQKRGSTNENKLMQVRRLSLTDRSFSEDTQPDELMHPYMTLLVDEILQKNYLTLAHFPRTLQLMVHLSAFLPQKEGKNSQQFVLSEERHEKIKNILLYLAEKIHLSLEELPYVLFLANFLLCMMHPPKVISAIVQLSNIVIAYPQLITWKSLIFELEKSHSQTPLSPATIDLRTILVQTDKLWLKIESIIDLGRRGEAVLREGLIRLSKIELNCDFKEYKKKISEGLKSLLGKKQDMDFLQEDHLNVLYLLKLERNSFTLILREAMEEQQQARLQLVHLNHKFKMEKDEFIEKIVKLNNKIQSLEKALKDLEENAMNGSKNMSKQSEQVYPEVKTQQIEESPQQIELESIITVTDLFNFNEKYYLHNKKETEQGSQLSLSQRIIVEIQRMQQTIEKNASRIKAVQQEKTRLLGIISRKEQRLLSVILQKDTIIQRYQQALWTMENGLEVSQGPLVNRIKYIMHIFASRQKIEEEEQVQVVAVGTKKKEKECEIY